MEIETGCKNVEKAAAVPRHGLPVPDVSQLHLLPPPRNIPVQNQRSGLRGRQAARRAAYPRLRRVLRLRRDNPAYNYRDRGGRLRGRDSLSPVRLLLHVRRFHSDHHVRVQRAQNARVAGRAEDLLKTVPGVLSRAVQVDPREGHPGHSVLSRAGERVLLQIHQIPPVLRAGHLHRSADIPNGYAVRELRLRVEGLFQGDRRQSGASAERRDGRREARSQIDLRHAERAVSADRTQIPEEAASNGQRHSASAERGLRSAAPRHRGADFHGSHLRNVFPCNTVAGCAVRHFPRLRLRRVRLVVRGLPGFQNNTDRVGLRGLQESGVRDRRHRPRRTQPHQ